MFHALLMLIDADYVGGRIVVRGIGVQICNPKFGLRCALFCMLQLSLAMSPANATFRTIPDHSNDGASSIRLNRYDVTLHRSLVFAGASLAQVDSADSNSGGIKNDPRVKRWRLSLMYGALLLVIFITAAAAIIVFSRRWRQWVRGGRKTGPTDAADVWAMHQTPDDDTDIDTPD